MILIINKQNKYKTNKIYILMYSFNQIIKVNK